ncbi:MAG: hypothetical protein ACK5D5_00950 [Bacteroidota bacterium]|jgi:hypothetical protein
MKTQKSLKNILFIVLSAGMVLPVSASNNYILDIIHPEYAIFYVVGLLILLAFVIARVLKRNEQRSNHIKSMKRYNRHRSVKQF